jgi:hypothetical protein
MRPQDEVEESSPATKKARLSPKIIQSIAAVDQPNSRLAVTKCVSTRRDNQIQKPLALNNQSSNHPYAATPNRHPDCRCFSPRSTRYNRLVNVEALFRPTEANSTVGSLAADIFGRGMMT